MTRRKSDDPNGMGDYYRKLYRDKCIEVAQLRMSLHNLHKALNDAMSVSNDDMSHAGEFESTNTKVEITPITNEDIFKEVERYDLNKL